jgi:nucleotide-binding universal stress UspA family protein
MCGLPELIWALEGGTPVTKDEIVVGLDDSDPSRAALKWAADQARLSGSTLRAVYVSDWPTGVRAGGRPLVVEDLVFVQEGELERRNRGAISKIFQEIAPKDDWSLEFASGKSGQILVDASRHSRLLVVGTGEHVGLGRILLGSTSHYCLGHASCPVVAVPALDDSSAGGSAPV